ncbi:PIN domain-like protein, partial [Vararia minispora EC-137]
MGVNGLWELLRPAGEPRSLVHVAVVDGFEANINKLRGLRIGIDASIWFYHAAHGREGENPELRTIFFRFTRLLEMPFLPLFVFDGPKRPKVKRGKRISQEQHWMINGMKAMIEAFGFEWRMVQRAIQAPGEAEAELAYLNTVGQIDAVLSDDVDTFVFGGRMVIRNPSATLSGNRGHIIRNADGRDDGKHSYVYHADKLQTHPDIQLTRGGLVLIALLNGGDYHPEGVPGCGPQIARGLARCGFGEQLLEAARKHSRDDERDMAQLQAFLSEWRNAIRQELRTNSRGYLPRKQATLSQNFPEDFPDIEVLYLYTNPVTSATDPSARRTHIPPTWPRDPDVGKIANLCELYFEWGIKEIIIKRFRTVLWDGVVLRALRRSAIELDARISGPPSVVTLSRKSAKGTPYVGTPVSRIRSWLSSVAPDVNIEDLPREGELVLKISSTRRHASTDGLLEYRLEITPTHLVPLCAAGIQGLRKPADTTFDVPPSQDESEDDEGGGEDGTRNKRVPKPPPDPLSMHRVWIPACIVHVTHPNLVEEFEGGAAAKAARKAAKAAGAGR